MAAQVRSRNKPLLFILVAKSFGMEDKENRAKRNKKRAKNFSADLKKMLAAQVKVHPRIRDVADRLHCRKDALEQSWMAISEVIGRPASECRAAWASMKKSYRCFAKVGKKGKSGDAGGEILTEPSYSGITDWQFAEHMAFLPSTSQKRITFTTFEQSPNDVEQHDTESVQYDFAPPPKRNQQENSAELLNRIGDLIQSKQRIQDIRAEAAQSTSNFQEAFNSFDWLLNKLPKDDAEQACEEFTQILMNKVNEQRYNQ